MEQQRLEEYLHILKQNSLYEKTTRSCLHEVEKPEDKVYVSVWAPALVEYVMWVLNQAIQDKKERLYFLSRDAYPMYLTAKKITEQLNIGPDCRYLRVSRYSLRIPEYHLMGEACLDRIFLSGIDVSFYQILKRTGLTKEQMRIICKELDYEKEVEQILNRKEIIDLKETVKIACNQGKTSLLDMVYEKSKTTYEAAIGYLEQEGLLDDVSWAIVDSGWVGTIQKSIQTLLYSKKEGIQICGYYFGLYELPADRGGCNYKAFYFMPREKIFRKVRFSNCLYEVIYSEPCAMVEGYEYKNDRYRPVFTGFVNPNSAELERNAELIIRYTDRMLKISKCEAVSYDNGRELVRALNAGNQISEALYSKLMSCPDEWEASYYGGFLFSDDISDDHLRNTANRLSQQDIKNLRAISKLKIMLGLSKKIIHESAWIEGSIVNAKENKEKNLRAARRAKYLTHLRQSVKAFRIK